MGSVSPLRLVYLALAVWGAIHPMYWFVTHMRETGTGLRGLIDAWYVNASTTGLTWDLTIAATALTIWIIAETRARRNWTALTAIPAIFGIGVSCGLPLYLFLRTRPVT
jgi:Terpene cyclase DEP1